MSRSRLTVSALVGALCIAGGAYVFAGDSKPAASATDAKTCDSTLGCEGCAPLDAKGIGAKLSKLKGLEGTWVGVSGPGKAEDHAKMKLVFHAVANGTAVVETMFPGTKEEMVNVYHPTADGVMVTHYCAMGVQPRMKLASSDDKSLKFAFVDSTNMKSRDEGHMDSLTLTIDGDRLIEEWTYFKAGQVMDNMTTKFEMKRQPQGQANATN